MYSILEAHPLTNFIVIAAMLVTPFYLFATFAFSDASLKKGALLGSVTFSYWCRHVFGVLDSATQ